MGTAGVGVCVKLETGGAAMKLGRAEGGWTFDNKFPETLGTFATETPGDGRRDAEDDILLRDSAISLFNFVGWQATK